MKKFYSFLIAMLVGVSAASAIDSYSLHGQITGNSNWESIALTKNGDGNWEYTGNFVNGEFGVKPITNGQQDGWISADGETTVDTAGKAYKAKYNGTNWTSTLTGVYTFTFNPDDMTVTFTEYEGELSEEVTYQIHGQITGNSGWESVDMIEENGKWSFEGDVVPGSFGIKKNVNGSQKVWYASAGSANVGTDQLDQDLQAKENGANWDFSLTGHYTFVFDPETLVLTISGEGQEVEPTYPATMYVISNNTNWMEGSPAKMRTVEDGIYECVFNSTAEGIFFRFASADMVASGDWNSSEQWGYNAIDGINATFAIGENTLVQGKGCFKTLAETKYLFQLDLKNMTFTVSEYAEPTITILIDEVEHDGSELTFTSGMTIRLTSDNSDVKFYHRWESAANAQIMTLDAAEGYEEHDSENGFTVPSAGTFSYYYTAPGTGDSEVKSIEIGGTTTGINAIVTDSNAPVEYYNLQGVRVENPANGLYIRRQGDKAEKVLVK